MDEHALLSWPEYVKLFVGLLSLADPIGNLPIILALTQKQTRYKKKKVCLSAVVTFVVTLLIFTFIGNHLLQIFGITIAALKVAGGILFLFYALDMLEIIQLPSSPGLNTSAPAATTTPDQPQPIGIVPIGLPMLAGPGTITKVLIYADLHPGPIHKLTITLAIVTVGIILYVLFRTLLVLEKAPDKITMTIISKVMGLVLAGIATEFMLEGIADFLTDQ